MRARGQGLVRSDGVLCVLVANFLGVWVERLRDLGK